MWKEVNMMYLKVLNGISSETLGTTANVTEDGLPTSASGISYLKRLTPKYGPYKLYYRSLSLSVYTYI
jgi:hypothetical protein